MIIVDTKVYNGIYHNNHGKHGKDGMCNFMLCFLFWKIKKNEVKRESGTTTAQGLTKINNIIRIFDFFKHCERVSSNAT